MAYPTSLDVLANPSGSTPLNAPTFRHATDQHVVLNDAIEAIEAKLGIGAGTAAAASGSSLLHRKSDGTSGWLLGVQVDAPAAGSGIDAVAITPPTAAKAKAVLHAFEKVEVGFNNNFVLALGHNYGFAASQPKPTQPTLAWVLEEDYQTTQEAYIDWYSAGGLVHDRPFQFNFNRTTGLTSAVYKAPAAGFLINKWDSNDGIAGFADGAHELISNSGVAESIVTISTPGPSAKLRFVHNSVEGGAIQGVNNKRMDVKIGDNGIASFQRESDYSGLVVGSTTFGSGVLEANLTGMTANNMDGVHVIFPSSPNSTWNIFDYDVGGTQKGRINHNGYMMTKCTSAPADGDIQTSEMAFWFDHTAGAAKAMFKAKNASGTVVTGSVALTT